MNNNPGTRQAATTRIIARAIVAVSISLLASGCFRGKLPPREFYRLMPVDSVAASSDAGLPPALTGSLAIATYETPGIYGSSSIVYRVGSSTYGAYPSREWAIPLGEMLGAITQRIAERRGIASGPTSFDGTSPRREAFEWRGVVDEFDEVDAPASVSAAVALSARLVRVSDDSVLWSGSVRETLPVKESRRMESVVDALSAAASRAIARLVDDAALVLRRTAAARAQDR